MTTEEKLLKLKKLADAMYYAAQQLTTDASRLHKAMDDYHQFIVNDYHEEETVNKQSVDEAMAEVEAKAKAFTEAHKSESSEQLLAEMRGEDSVSEYLSKTAITAADEDMQGRQIMEESNENRQLYSRIFRRGFKAGANWQKQQIMKEAVEGTARPDDNEIWCNLASSNLKDGDKVKVIVIKED